ncbi:cryptochrome/photolyase family protein [Actinomadura gamaensis]|uniref:Cryptochrome/photolyase family protein n=1 Tax=Actinomadura gamaensis TaxID=1763541 RepID=A0ABV9TNT0_9ACTN
MDTALMLFTRDLRTHDNPALAAAASAADRVVCAFVLDDTLLALSPNRARFLLGALTDLRGRLESLGGGLVLRHGDPAAEAVKLARETGATGVFFSEDVSSYASRRRARLQEACRKERIELSGHEGLTVVPPGALRPASGDHYRIFSPYGRAWLGQARRDPLPPPKLRPPNQRASDSRAAKQPPSSSGKSGPHSVNAERVIGRFTRGASPDLPKGGETEGRARMRDWLAGGLSGYADGRDDLAGDSTSRLSAYLRFGCVSPSELATAVTRETHGRSAEGAEAYIRQLAWRDFHYQLAAAFPELGWKDYRPRNTSWVEDRDALDAWREGRTGVPIVDAGMRQLRAEGWMHNRARLITASFLTRNLRVHWRHGLAHFAGLLVDGDLPNNAANWQRVAGTGNDTRPNQVMNPLRQAERFDARGEYVRRYVPELADLDTRDIHTPWETGPVPGYPPPIVELA